MEVDGKIIMILCGYTFYEEIMGIRLDEFNLCSFGQIIFTYPFHATNSEETS